MRLEITPNFISADECKFLNAWAYEGVEKGWLDKGRTRTGEFTDLRLNSRTYGDRFSYPKEVIDLSNKIRKFAGISNYPLIESHGKNGVVVSFTKPTGNVFEHFDNGEFNVSALRCNIITQEAEEGGELFVGGHKINVKAGDLHCYLATNYKHSVTEVKGSKPRILWMFGAAVPLNDWENWKIKYGIS